MGTVGGPYPLYAVDDEWFAGQSYSPGALVLWNGTVYLARDYVTNSQTSPDADTANFMLYAPTGSAPYTLPAASDSVLGGVKVGTGLTVDGSGVLQSGGAPRTPCYDSFRRNNQSDWGACSDGIHSWSSNIQGGTDNAVISHAGTQTGNASIGDGADIMYITPDVAIDDLDVVLRWSVSHTDDGLTFIVRVNGATLTPRALFQFTTDNADIYVAIAGDSTMDTPGSLAGQGGAALAAARGGDIVWTRLRASGLTYSWRSWADGSAEPVVWDGTHTTTAVCSGRSVAVQMGGGDVGHTFSITALRIEDLGDA